MTQNLFYLSFFLIVCYTFFLLYLWRGLKRAQHSLASQEHDQPFVSVIIAARNEGHFVSKLVSALLDQNYPQHLFEIIFVDDQSNDCTPKELERFAPINTLIVLQNSSHEKYKSSKKRALELGITKSRGELLLFVDADCTPPPSWIKSMVQKFDPSTGLVAGFSPQQIHNKCLNDILIIDAAAAAVVSAATIGFRQGVTCTGRNLAYRKQAFIDIGGFAALPNSLSGDDDFMLQTISKHPNWKVKYAIDANAVVPAVGPENLQDFLRQKQRHISAGKFYPLSSKIGFAVFHFSNFMIWLSLLWCFLKSPIFIFPLALKCIFDFLLLKKFLVSFNMKVNLKSFIFWQLLFVYYNTITGPIGFFKKIKW